MPTILLTYFILGLISFFFPGWLKKQKALVFALWQLVVFAYLMIQRPLILQGDFISFTSNWLPQLGINFGFILDGLSWIFALIVSGIGVLVFLYAHVYMQAYEQKERFYFHLLLFSGAMLGLVLSGNLIQLFIFWELTSVLSFLLISFFHQKEEARKAAFQSFYLTAFGGLSLLAGIILLGTIVDSYEVSVWIQQASEIKSSQLYLPGLILILGGVITKSAQFPFHFWLPGAMQAPAPVSSYLHSATMVKAGVFILVRLNPALGGTMEWTYIIPVVGVFTMLVGSYLAITQTDIKAILAYTTISALGILVLLTGIDTTLSMKAALVFLFVHAFYKATLFMVAGFIDKKTGTRDIRELGGLIKYLPVTFVISALALLSMAGLPPMLGFLGKELIYEAKVQSPGIANMMLILGVTSNIFMVAVSLFFLYRVFLGKVNTVPKKLNKNGMLFLIGPAILVLLSLVFGLFPKVLGPALEPALEVIRVEGYKVKLKLWHGFSDVFFLSLFTVVMGTALAFLLVKRRNVLLMWRRFNQKVFGISFSDLFYNTIERFIDLSKSNTRIVQHGYHRYYILTIILFAASFLWYQAYVTRDWVLSTGFSLQPFYITGLVLIIALSALQSAVAKSRLTTIIAMGVAGYGLSLIYLYYSAIDLAITQIVVETLTLVMFILILQRLPIFANLSSRLTKIRDLGIALLFGSVMTLFALKAINVDFQYPISDYYLENSALKAYGENVVNVILVDFRALDTLGEVTVIGIAALGVYVLLRKKMTKQ